MTENFNEVFDKTVLKQGMSIDSVFEFLIGKGIQGHWVNEETLVFETCCHNHIGEGSRKLYYYDNTKLFSCYTGCGGTFDIFELLNKINVVATGEEIDLDDSIRDYVYSQSFLFAGKQEFEEEVDDNVEYKKPVLQYFNPEIFTRFPKAYSKNWLQEGIDKKLHAKYNVRFNWFDNSLVFPHYDEFWNLVSVRQRRLADDDVSRWGKYNPMRLGDIMYSNPTSFYLFGLNYNGLNIRKRQKAIIYESEKSVMLMDAVLGPQNNIGTASFGMHFSRHQFELLKSMGVEEIIFAYDRQFKEASLDDMEFRNLLHIFRQISNRFEDKGIKITFILDDDLVSNYKDSPIDNGLEVFDKLYHSKRTMEELDLKYKEEVVELTQLPLDEDDDIFNEVQFNW